MVRESASSGYRNRADTYQEARPKYHPALVEQFAARYANGSIVDLGAGTGIFTAQLVEAGLEVVAVEPVEEMRMRLTSGLEGVRVVDGTAENFRHGKRWGNSRPSSDFYPKWQMNVFRQNL